MGIEKITVLVYSHTDYSDLWEPFFVSLRRYLPENTTVYLCTNSVESTDVTGAIPLIYDQEKSYTERLYSCLSQIQDQVVLFLHEDMILFDKPDLQKIYNYIESIEKGDSSSIKLIPVGEILYRSQQDTTLIHTTASQFSIQPTLIKVSRLQEILQEAGPVSIWELERTVRRKINDFVSYIGDEIKRGQHHYDSIVFPYTATAIVKGKWNFSEYEKELTQILKESNIDKEIRGVV
jgi:hypothetical protein